MTVFELTDATVVRNGRPVLDRLNWTMRAGEVWAVVGPTGSGKTTLAEALLGRHPLHGGALSWPVFDRLRAAGRRIDYPSQAVAHVTFKEDSRLFSYAGRYYQQRFEFADSASDTPLSLGDFLDRGTVAERAAVAERFGLGDRLAQPFMTLSNGQTRRARLARATLAKPEVLILDDPFIGLDTRARADFTALLDELVRDGKHLVLICREDAVPAWVTHALRLGGEPTTGSPCNPLLSREGVNSGVASPLSADGSLSSARGPTPPTPFPAGRGEKDLDSVPSGRSEEGSPEFPPLPPGRGVGGVGLPDAGRAGPLDATPLIQLTDVTVTHAGHTILDRVSWSVRGGERWAVLGPNGSGKTTLLSLLCGDHPQAYANDVRLFGRRRGTGETIWDVKRNVGLLSPEFHLYFSEPLTAERTAATGFFDALADRATTPEQNDRVRALFAALGIGRLAGRPFRALSSGEQRLVLLARALVKRPPLLILDEPFQGLDTRATAHCRAYLDRELGADQTLLFVTHEPTELPRTVSHTLRLERGRVVPG